MLSEIFALEGSAVGVILFEEHAWALGQCCWRCLLAMKIVLEQHIHEENTEWRNAEKTWKGRCMRGKPVH